MSRIQNRFLLLLLLNTHLCSAPSDFTSCPCVFPARPGPDLLHLPLIIPPPTVWVHRCLSGLFLAWNSSSHFWMRAHVSSLLPVSLLDALFVLIYLVLSGWNVHLKHWDHHFRVLKINFDMLIQGGTCPGFKSPWRPAAVGQLAMHVSKKVSLQVLLNDNQMTLNYFFVSKNFFRRGVSSSTL